MFKVYLNSVRQIGAPDRNGARSIAIGEESACVYEGCATGAIFKLRQIGVGVSVAVRYPGGLRSCMNKPSLWTDIAGMAA